MPAAGTQADALRISLSGTEVKHLHAVGTIPGVAVLAVAARNGPGVARIRSNEAGDSLQWLAPSSATWGDLVAVPSDGTYLLCDGDDTSKWARVQVYTAFLTAGAAEAQVWLADVYDNAIASDDVTAAEAAAGDVEDYTVTLEAATNNLQEVFCWVDAATTGLQISANGVTYSAPTTELTAISLGSIAVGAPATLYLRRTITAGASPDANVRNLLHFAFQEIA